jgi:hypothetical protein
MAKYELVKETTINGMVRYSIERDGQYVNRSVTLSLEEAEKFKHSYNKRRCIRHNKRNN